MAIRTHVPPQCLGDGHFSRPHLQVLNQDMNLPPLNQDNERPLSEKCEHTNGVFTLWTFALADAA